MPARRTAMVGILLRQLGVVMLLSGLIIGRASAETDTASFCVGVNVTGNDSRTIDTSLDCEGNSGSSSSSSTSSAGASSSEDSSEEENRAPSQGGYRGATREQSYNRIVDLLELRTGRTFRRAAPDAPSVPDGVESPPTQSRFPPRVIGRFRLRVQWDEFAPTLKKSGTSMRGAWASAYLMHISSPAARSQKFWQTLGFDGTADDPVTQIADEERSRHLTRLTLIGSAFSAALSLSDVVSFPAHPSELLLWIVLALVIGGVILHRHRKHHLHTHADANAHPAQPTLWGDREDEGN